MKNRDVEKIVEQPLNINIVDLDTHYSFVSEAYESYNESYCADSHRMSVYLQDSKTGQRINLAEYISKIYPRRTKQVRFGWNFMGGFGADVKQNIVDLPKKGLQDPKEFMSVLHEVGHIISYERYLKDNTEKAKSSEGSHFRADLESKKFHYTIEQDAWKEAIAAAEQLKQRFGLDIFGLFSSSQEFYDYVYQYLGSYKKRAIEAGSNVTYKTLYDSRFENFVKGVFERNKVLGKD